MFVFISMEKRNCRQNISSREPKILSKQKLNCLQFSSITDKFCTKNMFRCTFLRPTSFIFRAIFSIQYLRIRPDKFWKNPFVDLTVIYISSQNFHLPVYLYINNLHTWGNSSYQNQVSSRVFIKKVHFCINLNRSGIFSDFLPLIIPKYNEIFRMKVIKKLAQMQSLYG